MEHILIVDDDLYIGNMVEEVLTKEGYRVSRAYSGTEAVLSLSETAPDLVLLDLMLPGLSGEEILPKIRDVPIIVISAKADTKNKVDMLLNGAADYITKPFSLMVLRARVNAVLRRKEPEAVTYIQGGFSFDFDQMIFMVDGKSVSLSKTEQKLLKLLVTNRGLTLTRELLIDRIWSDGAEYVEENALSVTVRRLREKLPKIPIKTVYGVGYSFEREE